MSSAIKTWEYVDSSDRTDKVEYYDGYLVKTFGFETPRSNKITVNRMLDHYSCLTNSIVEPLIIKDLINLGAFNPAKFTEKEAKHWQFWKYLEASLLKEFSCEAISPIKSKTFLELSPAHLKNCYSNSFKKQYSNSNRLDNLFFYGPELVGMQLEDRKQIRQIVYKALSPEANFSLEDTFPLFDYSKIESMRWEKTSPDKFSGDYIELHSDRLTIGGWSNPRDGGAYDASIERVWSERFTASFSKFEEAYQQIYQVLENAIIKDVL
jgi:hypothetical protein